jgi:hypothetical protein
MVNLNTQIDEKQEKYKSFFPIILFIICTFFLEAVGISKAINLVISVFLSLIIYGLLIAKLQNNYGAKQDFKYLQKFIGYLTLIFILIIINAIFHWYKILSESYRWGLFFSLLLIYFILLFRAVNTLHQVKISLITVEEEKKK